ncbi:MAG TPA: bifunctional (p)ppGpp synthetase/guanosine-3',5'-bis(diphosphate) 3'-pyrophosphohydrolase [Burkholderiales bacterium]|jgi:GTP pyrophosphokinase|nr:bifunctional (p)ppGpp synthetase/guanosine-3',5'-bis(diphosphate) 3'-pyrophosphohydrolase [Burkholderiales bacterium]
MVKVREITRDIASAEWLEVVTLRLSQTERELVVRADLWAQDHYADSLNPAGTRWIEHVRAAVGVLSALRVDGEAIAATLLLGAPVSSRAQREALVAHFGPAIAALVEGVSSMALIQVLRGRVESGPRQTDRAAQLESLRKMLLAMVQDVRVVLIKLADQVQLLRELAASGDAQARENAAGDTMDLFAPLANRLGVWQIKWELEDLAFRCLDPHTYKNLARQLDEKRVDRETYIVNVVQLLRAELATAGIAGEVAGRPKHIYSIWRKMQSKDVGLEDLFDVRAVRVLVHDVKECYTVLGLVHNLWTPVPREFDDYIAKPKANDYRSLHTAVMGAEGKVLEVQIRTYEMHRHAELGVAAHWRYKEAVKGDTAFDDRITWLRRILDWRDELADAGELAEYFKTELFQDSVYVVTPQGRVIDLPRGATPVDFAYHVHSQLGHRCRGAKVNGQIVPLTYTLSNGQRVEIITTRDGGPSRDWLNPALGYLKSNRARAKVRQWFNSQQLEEATTHGRAVLERELHRLGKIGQNLDELAARLNFARVEELLAAFGRAEVTPRQLQSALGADEVPVVPAVEAKAPSSPARPGAGGILVVGVDKLLTVLARCCKPAPPDPIVGFVTRGRGVTVHRRDCSNVERLAAERLIAADWGKTGEARFPVDVEIIAGAHPALLRDILDIFTREKVRVITSKAVSRDLNARIALTLEVEGLPQLKRLLELVRDVPGVESARRR